MLNNVAENLFVYIHEYQYIVCYNWEQSWTDTDISPRKFLDFGQGRGQILDTNKHLPDSPISYLEKKR